MAQSEMLGSHSDPDARQSPSAVHNIPCARGKVPVARVSGLSFAERSTLTGQNQPICSLA